jgi:hypothetical protein
MRIVVDTSVARAAGDSGDRTAQMCLNSLEAILEKPSHLAAFNQSLLREWFKEIEDRRGRKRRYASSSASEWFLKMRRRLVVLPERKDFINQCIQASASLAAASAIQKDLHLVDLAIQADHRVLSTDKKIVGHLRQLGKHVPEVCPILWVHPVDHKAPAWLAGGAPARDDCRIC